MLRAIDSLGAAPFSPGELQRVRAHYLTGLAESYANNWGCAGLLAGFFARGQPAGAFASIHSQVASVDAAELQRVARRWFSRDRVQVTVVAEPSESGYDLAEFGRVEWLGFQSTVKE